VIGQIFEPLVIHKLDSTDIEPNLAESWTISRDGLTYTFKLRKEVKFHDGTPLDAEAVKFSFERPTREDHPYFKYGKWTWLRTYLGAVKTIEVVDSHTVRFHLKERNAAFLANLANWGNTTPVSPTAVKKDPEGFAVKPVGSGKYRFESWERGVRVVLRRNDDYWGDKAKVERLIFRWIVDAQARVAELLSGTCDIIHPIFPDAVAQLERTPNVTVIKAPELHIWFAGFNLNDPVMKDVRVRRALNHAINKEALLANTLQGLGTLATQPALPTSWAYEPDVRRYPYDPQRAKQLLAEAGYPNGLETELWTPESGSGMQTPKEMATVMQADLAAVGVRARVKVFEWGTYLGTLRKEPGPLWTMSWFLHDNDPDISLSLSLHSKGVGNFGKWQNAEFDRALEDARKLLDRKRRAEIYRRAMRAFADDPPWIFVNHEFQLYGLKKGLKFTPHPAGFELRMDTAYWE
jgi:peptide/nickel transport system substrate-binding protein